MNLERPACLCLLQSARIQSVCHNSWPHASSVFLRQSLAVKSRLVLSSRSLCFKFSGARVTDLSYNLVQLKNVPLSGETGNLAAKLANPYNTRNQTTQIFYYIMQSCSWRLSSLEISLFFETGYNVAKAGLELLILCLCLPNAKMVHHHTWLEELLFLFIFSRCLYRWF